MDAAGARDKITRAAGLLVNRFGHESDVFALLNGALDDLKDSAPVPAVVEEETTPPPVLDEQKAGTPGSKPRKAGVKHGRR